jgi:hypothetical protein
VPDFHIVGGTRSEVVGSVSAGGRLARRSTPCCPVSLWCNGCSVGRAVCCVITSDKKFACCSNNVVVITTLNELQIQINNQ